MEWSEKFANSTAQTVINDARIKYLEKMLHWLLDNNQGIEKPNEETMGEFLKTAYKDAIEDYKKGI